MGACSSSGKGAPSLLVTNARADRVEREADVEFVTSLKEDGRLLADYLLHLKENDQKSEILDVWALDLALSGTWDDFDAALEQAVEVASRLEESWEAYKASPEGLGNFDDTREWAQHDFPDKAIVRKIGAHDKRKRINRDNEMYGFSIAAMVGVHVAIVCSDLITQFAMEIVQTADKAMAAFSERFPTLDLLDCQQKCVRVFPVPPNGSAYSPHTCLDEEFEIEEMSPRLFAEVRKVCGIARADFFDSICRTDFEFISFGTNSKSGEFFFFSHDDKYLLKTTTEFEARTLVEMLPRYLERMKEEPRTMLGRYLGLYRLHYEGKDQLFFIMRAVTSHTHEISRMYDLKGSVHNRRAKPGDSIGKDLNFWEELGQLKIPPAIAAEVAEVHRIDVEFLKEFRIMDFSLLLQIHDKTGKYFSEHGVNMDLVKSNTQSVKLLDGAHGSRPGTWLRNGPQNAFDGLSPAARRSSSGSWLPHNGSITREDGTMLYTFGLIDMLVPYDTYPKLQYVGEEIISCGHGLDYSRVPPDYYCERQVRKVHEFCGVRRVDDDSDDDSEG